MKAYGLVLPFEIQEDKLSEQQSNYLYSRILRLVKTNGVKTLEILPGRQSFLTEDYELTDQDTGIKLGLRWGDNEHIEMVRLAGDSITPINTGLSKYESLWNSILSRINSEYNTREYELYYSFERNVFIIIPEIRLLDKQYKKKLFKSMLEADLGWVEFLVTQPELFTNLNSPSVQEAVLNSGYSQIWVSLGELDPFRDEKTELLRKLIENSTDKTNIDPMVGNIIDTIRDEVNENNTVIGNYRMLIGNKTEDLNKDFIHWIMLRDIVLEMIPESEESENLNWVN